MGYAGGDWTQMHRTIISSAKLQARLDEVDRLRQQQVERARYEAEPAQHRYMRVDPDNRLVADTLEADWNRKLRAVQEAQQEYDNSASMTKSQSMRSCAPGCTRSPLSFHACGAILKHPTANATDCSDCWWKT